MASINYDVIYEDGEKKKYKNQVCFISFSAVRDIGTLKQLKYFPNNKVEPKQALEFTKDLFELGFGKYINEEPEECLKSVTLDLKKFPPVSVITILTPFRYIDEFPGIVKTYLALKAEFPKKNKWLLFWVAHWCDVVMDDKYAYFSRNSNHTLCDTSDEPLYEKHLDGSYIKEIDRVIKKLPKCGEPYAKGLYGVRRHFDDLEMASSLDQDAIIVKGSYTQIVEKLKNV